MTLKRTVLALATLSLVSCSATEKVGEWRNPKHAGEKFRRVFVIGVTKDALGRRMFEDSMLRRIKAVGGDAVMSYSVLPSEEKLGNDEVAARVKEASADLVLVAKVVGRSREYVQHQSADVIMAQPIARAGWYGYYSGSWDTVHSTTYTSSYEVLHLETQLFETASEEIVWLASWDTALDTSREAAMESFTEAVTEGLLQSLELPKPAA